MKIWLNGESAETPEGQTVAGLAQQFGLQPSSILIEHNGLALHLREWTGRVLAEGDRVEFIRVVAGG